MSMTLGLIFITFVAGALVGGALAAVSLTADLGGH
jgi:hypothetical protein